MSPRRRTALAAAALVAGLAAAVALAAAGGLLAGRPEGIPDAPPGTASIADATAFEPLALCEVSEEELLERARDGFSHPLYALSPGGAPASAARTARFRAPLEAAAGRHGIGPDTLEALVMLESAGRPDVAAGDDPEGAVGLGQILPGTATALLGMRVDLEASRRLSAAIERARRRAERARSARTRRAATRRAAALARRRRAVDKRYDPARSLDGAARYLAIAERRFGREDLALASYHMGMGNLERTVETYVAPARPAPRVRDTVAAHDVSYVRLYFGSSPVDNARTYALLAGFGDDSRTYLFRLEAAREIMRLRRDDPAELARRAGLHALWPSGELVLRPPAETDRYSDAHALRAGYDEGELVPLGRDPMRLGFTLDPAIGRLSLGRARGRPALYRGLRPEALAALLYLTKEVDRVAGRAGLRVTGAARDAAYGRHRASGEGAGEPAGPASPHATGYSFDIARPYPSRQVANAFAYALERLRALRVIDYAFRPGEVHVGVGPDTERLLPLQRALAPAPGD